MRYRELAKRLAELGCRELRHSKGSHCTWYNPATSKVATVPNWGAKDLSPGTVRAVIRELGISRGDFGPIK